MRILLRILGVLPVYVHLQEKHCSQTEYSVFLKLDPYCWWRYTPVASYQLHSILVLYPLASIFTSDVYGSGSTISGSVNSVFGVTNVSELKSFKNKLRTFPAGIDSRYQPYIAGLSSTEYQPKRTVHF